MITRCFPYRFWPAFLLAVLVSAGCSPGPDQGQAASTFASVPVDFSHQWDETVHPFSGAAVIDIDGDGAMEVFVGGGNQQADALLGYRDGRMVNLIEGTGLSSLAATYGSASLDMDNDGDVDLVVARADGVFLYLNDGGVFSGRKVPVDLPPESVVLGIAFSDIDHDGDADMYLSVFVDFPFFRSAVYNDADHAKANRLLLNNGDLTFTDITATSNTAGSQNTFLSVFVDLDNDGWQDLALAQNTGQVELLRNNGDLTFTPMPLDSGFGFWMGVAVGDIDSDGDQDLFFSNAGGSIPAFLTSGDLRDDQRANLEWLLLRNDGDFSFTEVTDEYGLTGDGFAWGAIFEDMNLDGRLDLMVAQNYIKWPIHQWLPLPGRASLQSESGSFADSPMRGIDNPLFGQSPVSADFDSDGRPDLLWLNMDGPARAFLNLSEAAAFKVIVPETADWLGTRVQVVTDAGASYTREIITSTGMLTDQGPDLIFGLPAGQSVKQVVLVSPSGEQQIIDQPANPLRLAARLPAVLAPLP